MDKFRNTFFLPHLKKKNSSLDDKSLAMPSLVSIGGGLIVGEFEIFVVVIGWSEFMAKGPVSIWLLDRSVMLGGPDDRGRLTRNFCT